jgi:hypothetical protein
MIAEGLSARETYTNAPLIHVDAGEDSQQPERIMMSKQRKNTLLLAGGLGLVAVGLLAAAPELGFGSAIASVVTGGASAVTTLIAKR